MGRSIWVVLIAALLAAPLAAGAEEIDAEKLYLKHCKNCHGADGKAETKMGKKHDIDSFADAGWQQRHSDEKIRTAIASGKEGTKMKAYEKKLSPAEIDALVKFVRTFDPSKGAK